MPEKNSMKPLYDKLRGLGFTKPFIQSMLPEWWDDRIAETRAGYIESALTLSKLFNIDLKSLLDNDNTQLQYKIPLPNFKATKNKEYQELLNAVSLSTTAARACLRSFQSELKIDNITATSIRKILIEDRGNKWIDFRTLLEYIWEIGIPVLFLKLPDRIKKMQGLAIAINNRPVIILTSRKDYGYLAFDLAHELGHILCGHISKENIIIDEKIDQNSTLDKEAEANQFALELLTGKKDTCYHTNHTDYKHISLLVHSCISYGKQNNIDPSHILLNIAYHTHKWAVANSWLKELKKKLSIKESDYDICRKVMFERLDDFSEMKELENPMKVLTGVF